MKCRKCFHPKSHVIETRAMANTIWRRRRCDDCGHVWVTQEALAERMPKGIHKSTKGTGTKSRPLFKPMKPKNLPQVLFPAIKEQD